MGINDDPYLSWLSPTVAGQMLALSKKNSPSWDEHPPYRYFIEAMKWVRENIFPNGQIALVDAGCGVGHYAPIIGARFRGVAYRGFDFSPEMIRLAKQSWIDVGLSEEQASAFFEVADAKTYNYSCFDVVFASSLIEVMDNWWEGAEAICKTAKNIILLHRVRYGDKTERIREEGYRNQPTWMWIHNEVELLTFFKERGFDCIRNVHWDINYAMATYIFQWYWDSPRIMPK